MKHTTLSLVTAVGLIVSLSTPSLARDMRHVMNSFHADLSGLEEVPAVLTTGMGQVKVQLVPGVEIQYRLSYSDTIGDVLQAHIHIGQPGVNGGVAAFLCNNMGNGPSGTPPCSDEGVEGAITPDQVVGPEGQGISPGALGNVMAAIRAGVAYVNVHSDAFPTGEIRGQLEPRMRRHMRRR